MSNTTPKVYAAIAAVMGALSRDGIAKDRTNSFQKFNFRGIDDVLNALSPILTENNLLILPRVVARSEEERLTKNDGRMAYVTVEAEFDLVTEEGVGADVPLDPSEIITMVQGCTVPG